MRLRAWVACIAVAAVSGVTVASLVGIPQLAGPASIPALLANAFTFWGIIFGVFAAALAGALTFALLNRRQRRASRAGRVIAGVVLAILAAATISWIAMWGVGPWTLEGVWIYALAISAALASFVLIRPRRAGPWDDPGRNQAPS